MTGFTVKVALENAASAYDKLYTYTVPPEMQDKALTGRRVLVPFGKGNIKKQGMVFAEEIADTERLKPIYSVIDNSPVLNAEMLGLCEYMRETTFCTYYDAVHIMLPTGLNYSLISSYTANGEFSSENLLNNTEREVLTYLKANGESTESAVVKALGITADVLDGMCEKQAVIKNRDIKRRLGDATQKWVRPAVSQQEFDGIRLTPRRREIADLVYDNGAISVQELRYFTGASLSVINALIKDGILEEYRKQVFRTPKKSGVKGEKNALNLTDEQQTAFDNIINDYNKGGKTALLYGVTGSGKTQVFLALADYVAAQQRGVIVMVPEISLTPQLIEIFTSRYGDKIAVFHSAMSMGQRMDEWQRIKSGKALIAIGTRSAIFAPFKDLGLIIIDEEQEHTYKSEKTPRFHARDIAKYRTAYHKGLLCLASATPSLESYTNAKNGKYSLYTLAKRYGNAVLPTVEVVDMKKEILGGNASSISNFLYEEIKKVLNRNKQAIILLNRRGHNTYVSCADCGEVISCPNCSVSLTYHSANKRLMCHYCGYSAPADGKCPVCGGEHIKFMGLGTQKIEEELKKLFPSSRVLRIDADSTLARDSYNEYLTAFKNKEYDILIGTQMVAKGLNFPDVTLVGVLGADSAAYSEDFRSFERTFSLLTQVVGRAGRGDSAGTAVVQTLNPDSTVISLAAKQDYDGFYNEEILTRQVMTYPPYCDICMVYAVSVNNKDAEYAVDAVFKRIKELLSTEYGDVKLIILGPSPAAVPKVNNKYRRRMIIKCRNGKRFRDMLRKALDIKLPNGVSLNVDINPETII